MQAKVNTKNFIRYDEGAERYSMSKHSFMKLAQDARAVYKINRITLVNVKIFEIFSGVDMIRKRKTNYCISKSI